MSILNLGSLLYSAAMHVLTSHYCAMYNDFVARCHLEIPDGMSSVSNITYLVTSVPSSPRSACSCI